ncbi:MAG TPA: S53 family peptidase [Tepidisphaeraceae bacterium]|nr:S53 family peptidase [Tepidisphaeraceae bacterium]
MLRRLFGFGCMFALCAVSSAAQFYSPADIRTAYGINNINFGGNAATGNGQTIAIISAFHNSTILSDLNTFDTQFGIAPPPSFSVVNQSGGVPLPTGTDASFAQESDFDVEWAHAIAPQAKILLVEANNNSDANLFAAAASAAKADGTSVVSMSFGNPEFATENVFDSSFVTPANHSGVSFVASAGSNGGVAYPSAAPTVLAVGGTALTLNASGGYGSEQLWNDSSGAGGGGNSAIEAKPTYQNAAQSSTARSTPDVSFHAADNVPYVVCIGGQFFQFIGSDAATPNWAGLLALADQGRAFKGLDPLDSSDMSATGLLPQLYSLLGTPNYNLAFNDITTGTPLAGQTIGAGYDTSTGLGSPKADVLIPFLAGYGIVPEPASIGLLLPLAISSLLARRRVTR